MTTFDWARYVASVLKPLRGRRVTRADWPTVYAVEPEMSAADLDRRLSAVRRLWEEEAAGTRESLKRLCRSLIELDVRLRDTPEVRLDDPAFWRGFTPRRWTTTSSSSPRPGPRSSSWSYRRPRRAGSSIRRSRSPAHPPFGRGRAARAAPIPSAMQTGTNPRCPQCCSRTSAPARRCST